MPLAVEKLTRQSTMDAIRTAIAQTIRYLMQREGKTQQEAAGQAYGMAREKTGRSLGKKG